MQSTSYNTNQLPVQIKILTAKKNGEYLKWNGGGGWTEWNKMTEICTDVWQIYLYHIYIYQQTKRMHIKILQRNFDNLSFMPF